MEAPNLPDGYTLVQNSDKVIIDVRSKKKIHSRTELEIYHAQGQFLDLHVSMLEACLGIRRQQTMLNVSEQGDQSDDRNTVEPNDGEGDSGDGVDVCESEAGDEPGDRRPVAKRILPSWMLKPQVECSVDNAKQLNTTIYKSVFRCLCQLLILRRDQEWPTLPLDSCHQNQTISITRMSGGNVPRI